MLSVCAQRYIQIQTCRIPDGRPAWSRPSLACPAYQWGKPLCFISPPPGAATVGPRASSGAGSRPVAAVAQAPVVCGDGAEYRRRRRDPMLASIYQPKTHDAIYYHGVVVQPAGQYPQGTGFSHCTGTMRIFLTGRSMDMKEYTRIWRGIGRAVGRRGSGAAKAKLCMVVRPWIFITDMYHGWNWIEQDITWITLLDVYREILNGCLLWIFMDIICWISKTRYELRIIMDITEYQLDTIDGYLNRYLEYIYIYIYMYIG